MADSPQRSIPPHPRNGLPRVAPEGGGAGRPAYDWQVVAPMLLDAVASGVTVVSAADRLGLDHSDAYRVLTSDEWGAQFSEARRAGALARIDKSQQRLEDAAESGDKERINGARWVAQHAQWWAERGDSERWGREDRLKVQSVSAVRVIVEVPPVAAQLPAPQGVTSVTARVAQQLGTGQPAQQALPVPDATPVTDDDA